ncbi:unnamed protein product, partial [Brenthis ino]
MSALAEELLMEERKITTPNYQTISPNEDIIDIENSLEKIEHLAVLADKSRKDGVLPIEHTEYLYEKITDTLDELVDFLKTSQNTYKFLNNKGIHRIINSIIGINYESLKKQFLIILKTLFIVAPVTTNEVIPSSIIDKLLDIFENDDNLALKAHALDIMHTWLPRNPKIQARVMKLKGLEPFYHQVTKLDISVVYTLLELFNNILQEHLIERSKSQKDKTDFETIKLYENIGLIERMSTPTVCNGLLNIFKGISVRDDLELPPVVFDLLRNIKPFCLKIYKGKAQDVNVFKSLRKKVNNNIKFDIIDAKKLLEEYIQKINGNLRDEF